MPNCFSIPPVCVALQDQMRLYAGLKMFVSATAKLSKSDYRSQILLPEVSSCAPHKHTGVTFTLRIFLVFLIEDKTFCFLLKCIFYITWL